MTDSQRYYKMNKRVRLRKDIPEANKGEEGVASLYDTHTGYVDVDLDGCEVVIYLTDLLVLDD